MLNICFEELLYKYNYYFAKIMVAILLWLETLTDLRGATNCTLKSEQTFVNKSWLIKNRLVVSGKRYTPSAICVAYCSIPSRFVILINKVPLGFKTRTNSENILIKCEVF